MLGVITHAPYLCPVQLWNNQQDLPYVLSDNPDLMMQKFKRSRREVTTSQVPCNYHHKLINKSVAHQCQPVQHSAGLVLINMYIEFYSYINSRAFKLAAGCYISLHDYSSNGLKVPELDGATRSIIIVSEKAGSY